MPTHKSVLVSSIAAFALCAAPMLAQLHAQPAEVVSRGMPKYGLGKTPTAQQIAGWDIDASQPDGSGLPQGSGSVSQGERVYEESCVACHGPGGGGPMFKLVGGDGTLATKHPVQTIGSYWPYATTLWDYINRAMPLTSPHSLSHDQVYAVAAYVLYLNHVVPKDAVMNASTLPKVKMPNAVNFISPDPRPDVHNIACMENCPGLDARNSSNVAK